MKKRFLSILTALCLTLTLLPTAALAAEQLGLYKALMESLILPFKRQWRKDKQN